jgi:AbrB family looped-hinge helix DNA binding protein
MINHIYHIFMKKKSSACLGELCGTTTVGPRGQIVIPKEARSQLKLKPGNQFLVIEHFGKLVLVPEPAMHTMIKHITQHLK